MSAAKNANDGSNCGAHESSNTRAIAGADTHTNHREPNTVADVFAVAFADVDADADMENEIDLPSPASECA